MPWDLRDIRITEETEEAEIIVFATIPSNPEGEKLQVFMVNDEQFEIMKRNLQSENVVDFTSDDIKVLSAEDVKSYIDFLIKTTIDCYLTSSAEDIVGYSFIKIDEEIDKHQFLSICITAIQKTINLMEEAMNDILDNFGGDDDDVI